MRSRMLRRILPALLVLSLALLWFLRRAPAAVVYPIAARLQTPHWSPDQFALVREGPRASVLLVQHWTSRSTSRTFTRTTLFEGSSGQQRAQHLWLGAALSLLGVPETYLWLYGDEQVLGLQTSTLSVYRTPQEVLEVCPSIAQGGAFPAGSAESSMPSLYSEGKLCNFGSGGQLYEAPAPSGPDGRQFEPPLAVTLATGERWFVSDDNLTLENAQGEQHRLGHFPRALLLGAQRNQGIGRRTRTQLGLQLTNPESVLVSYFDGAARTLTRVDRDGARLWTRSVASFIPSVQYEENENRHPWIAATPNEVLLGLTRDAHAWLVNVDPQTGTPRWIRALP